MPKVVFVGSTPGDSVIKSLLTIPQSTKVDFIRWDLSLDIDSTNSKRFLLNINFGVAKQNTSGFISDGEKLTLQGSYNILKKNNRVIYQLNSGKQTIISLFRLNDNLLHILTPENKLMVGNGGWSYTLNRKETVNTASLTSLTTAKEFNNKPPQQVVFEGRSPCQQIAVEHPEMNANSSCHKLKWRLILNRDPIRHIPTTYTLRKIVNNEPADVSGKWKIIKGTTSNPDVIIYQLDPDKPEESLSFLAGDDNVLFFVNKKNSLYVGNKDFSFTLNRKSSY